MDDSYIDQFCFFDIETVPDESRMDKFKFDPLPPQIIERPVPLECTVESITGPKSSMAVDKAMKLLQDLVPPVDFLDKLLDAEECRENPRKSFVDGVQKLKRERQAYQDAVDSRNLILSTCPEYCRIVSIGVAVGNGEVRVRSSRINPTMLDFAEVNILEFFWKEIVGSRLCGYNCIGFDLPVIFARSAMLGVRPSRGVIDTTPWKNEVVDLYFKRFPKGPGKGPGKLKEIAPLYGISVPAGNIDGSDIYPLWSAGDMLTIEKYQASDVVITRELFKKWCGLFF